MHRHQGWQDVAAFLDRDTAHWLPQGPKAATWRSTGTLNPHMGGCQNNHPLLGTYILGPRCRIIIGIQEGTINLTTTHIVYVLANQV